MITNDPIRFQTAQVPLKVAICGGGVGGMFLGFTLQKKGFDVTVYEKTAQFSRFGGPLQLASNALSCIKAIDEVLYENVMNRFTFTGTRKVVSTNFCKLGNLSTSILLVRHKRWRSQQLV